MLIVGAKGFAKELLEIVRENYGMEQIAFYDDLTKRVPTQLYDKYPIIKNLEEAREYMQKYDHKFSLGLGNPTLRRKMYDQFKSIDGQIESVVSKYAFIAKHDVEIGKGTIILPGAKISNGVQVGKCSLIYYDAIITHDVSMGDFVELSPGATLLGNCEIGNYTQVGGNATVLPNIKVGSSAIIGAGAVVTNDVPDNSTVAGVPAKIIKHH